MMDAGDGAELVAGKDGSMQDCLARQRRQVKVAFLRSQGHSTTALARRLRCSPRSILTWAAAAGTRNPLPVCLVPLPQPLPTRPAELVELDQHQAGDRPGVT